MPHVTLTINSPGGASEVRLNGDALTFGRTDAAGIRIPEDAGLSRRHATVRRDGARVWIVDEGSTNGSFVNDARVSPEGLSLSDGDQIRIGHSTTIAVHIIKDEPAATRDAPSGAQATPPAPAADESAPTTTPAASLPLKVLVPVLAVVVIVLGAVGFLLYQLTRPTETRSAAESDRASETRRPESAAGATPERTGPASQETPTPAPVVKVREDISILSAAPNATTVAPVVEVAPAPAQRRLYKEMAEAEKTEFIKRRAQHVATMMGRRPYAFTPEALTHVKFWLDAFARRVGNNRTGLWSGDTVAILERGRTHAPTIVRAFRDNNVPVIVGLYIPFIETEYTNITTNNFAGAAGLFQFLGPTAEHYGVPSAERTDVAKMAPAAARYFRDNIMSFGDDPMSVALSIAGYNRAPESVKRDLRNVLNAPNNEDKERSFWTLIANQGKLDEYFQRENVNYVPRFFAAAIIGETPWAFGIEMRPLSTYTEQ
ncbi:MAG TPA: FHA domain-containing protein [Pyrinomonadaceae bacterium]